MKNSYKLMWLSWPVSIYSYLTTLTLLIEISSLLLQYAFVGLFVRLRKAPYADSYWFLYSAKVTYYTERHLQK